MNEEKNNVQYYEFFLIGEIVKDTNNNPVKNADGTIQVKFTRVSIPTTDLIAAGLTANKFFQCVAVEVNVEKDKLTASSGKSWEIGPMVDKGINVNIFENKQSTVFGAITQRFRDNKFTTIIRPEEGKPTIHLTDWALPGKVVEFATGFKYYVKTRNKQTHAMEFLISTKYDDNGKIIPKNDIRARVIKTTGTLFLFNNEIPAMEAHVKDAIAVLAESKVPDVTPDTRKDEVLETAKVTAATKPATTDI